VNKQLGRGHAQLGISAPSAVIAKYCFVITAKEIAIYKNL